MSLVYILSDQLDLSSIAGLQGSLPSFAFNIIFLPFTSSGKGGKGGGYMRFEVDGRVIKMQHFSPVIISFNGIIVVSMSSEIDSYSMFNWISILLQQRKLF